MLARVVKCDVNSRRLQCTCPPGYTGHRCKVVLPPRSCKDVMIFKQVKTNGIYNITDQQNISFAIYCDFDSEPGVAWTLIQSHSFRNNDAFKSKAFFHYDMAINQDAPEWNSYGLSMSRMKPIRNVSTHWRATCNFLTDGVDYRDYIRTSFDKNDLFDVPGPDRCAWYELVDIGGNRWVDCTSYSPYSDQYGYHIDSWHSTDLGCDFDGKPNGGVESEDNFGEYGTINPSFRCSALMASTIQDWIGGREEGFISLPPRSCKEVMMLEQVNINGIYNIVDQHNVSFSVYCDFGSESGVAWTLIQSHSLQNNDAFQSKVFYLYEMRINQDAPEWNSYRLSMSRMKSIQDVSTHWRATCNFPTTGVEIHDYWRVSLKNLDWCTRYSSHELVKGSFEFK